MLLSCTKKHLLYLFLLLGGCGSLVEGDRAVNKMDARLVEIERMHHLKVNALVREYHGHLVRFSRVVEGRLRGQVDDNALDNIQATLDELKFQILSMLQDER